MQLLKRCRERINPTSNYYFYCYVNPIKRFLPEKLMVAELLKKNTQTLIRRRHYYSLHCLQQPDLKYAILNKKKRNKQIA